MREEETVSREEGRCLQSQSVDHKASNCSFLFFCDDHAFGLVPEEEGTCIPGTLVFGTLLLQNLGALVFEINEHVTIVFDAAVNILGSKLLVVGDTNQVDAPSTLALDFAHYLTQFQ